MDSNGPRATALPPASKRSCDRFDLATPSIATQGRTERPLPNVRPLGDDRCVATEKQPERPPKDTSHQSCQNR